MAATVVEELVAVLGFKVQGKGEAKEFERSLDDIEKRARKMGMAIGFVAGIITSKLIASFKEFTSSVVEASAQFEQFQTSLETIEGSATKAKTSMAWIQKFAAETPYELDEVTRAFIKLKTYGFEPTDGTLRTLGDTASAMSKQLNQAVEAFADAATGEFERLKEFGLKAKKEKEKVTFTWTEAGKEQKKEVKESNEEITKFLKEFWTKRFGGAMERQSKTWKGMMSNLKDAWTQFKKEIGDAGFFDAMKAQLKRALDAVEAWRKDGTWKRATEYISGLLEGGLASFDKFVTRMSKHAMYIYENWEKIAGVVKTLGVAFGVALVRAHPLLAAITAIGLILDDWLTYMRGGESVIGDILKRGIGNTFNDLDQYVTNLVKDWVKVLAKYLRDTWKEFTDWAGDLLEKWWNDIDFVQWGKTMGEKLIQGLTDTLPDWLKNFLGVKNASASTEGGGGGGTPMTIGVNPRRRSLRYGEAPEGGRRSIRRGVGTYELTGAGASDNDINAAAKAIKGIESGGGNYRAVNPITKAAGAYQVMPQNIGPWTAKHYGKRLTWNEYLNNKEAQDAVFRGEFGGYMKKYGPEGAARAWYGGPGAVYKRLGAKDAHGRLTVYGYGRQFYSNFLKHRNSQLTTQDKPDPAQKFKDSGGLTTSDDTLAKRTSVDQRQNSTSITAPVTVNVKQASEAPAAVGKAISDTVKKGPEAQPARMQATPIQ